MALSTHRGPRWPDPHHAQNVTPVTLERYRKAATRFCAWLDEHGFTPMGEEDRDSFLVEYKNSKDLKASE